LLLPWTYGDTSSYVHGGDHMARVLSHADLRDRGIKYSKQHLNRLMKRGLFPRPVKLGSGGINTWLEYEIDRYLEDRIKARDAAGAEAHA
jgi:prophage regulatory protein